MFLLFITSNSCAPKGFELISNTIIKPVNIDRANGKWVIDEPLLEKVDISFESTTLELYEKLLKKKYTYLKSIRDFHMTSIKSVTEKNKTALDFYKQKTNCDYLIATTIKLIKVDDDNLTKELYMKIITYDLNTKKVIFEKEYNFKDNFIGFKDSPFSSNLKKFIDISLKKGIKDFAKDKTWNTVNSSPVK